MNSNNKRITKKYVDISSGKISEKKHKISFWKILLIILIILLLTAIGIISYFYKIVNSFNFDTSDDSSSKIASLDGKFNNINQDAQKIDLNDNKIINNSSVLNVLLFGSDTLSKTDNGRSDSILLLSLDNKNKKIKLTSIMRDIWVKIPGYYSDRINSAYSIGGSKLAIETIEKNFGVGIDRYAAVDFDHFAKIIDTLGGIDIELTASESKYINIYSRTKGNTLKGGGIKHLTGEQALQHSRNRNSIGSDYDRTKRQRKVILSVIEKFKNSNIAQITKVISDVAPMITTNFKPNEITKLTANCLTYLKYEFKEFRIPTDDNIKDATINGKMVLLIPNITKVRKDLAEFIYESLIVQN